jgi:hypothetical protein
MYHGCLGIVDIFGHVSRTLTQQKVQESGEYYTNIEKHHFRMKNNGNSDDLTI